MGTTHGVPIRSSLRKYKKYIDKDNEVIFENEYLGKPCVYIGKFEDQKSGQGRIYQKKKKTNDLELIFEGEINGLIPGYGYYYHYTKLGPSRSVYRFKGTEINGMMEGKGTKSNTIMVGTELESNKFKVLYEGEFKNDQYHGRGKKIRGDFTFDGFFKNGVFIKGRKLHLENILYEGYIGKIMSNRYRCYIDVGHGRGKLYFEDGSGSIKYDGYFFEGEIVKGKEFDQSGKLIYKGEFQNGKWHGKGVSYFDNGQIRYKGEFKNGLRNGKGISYGTLIKHGRWKDGKLNGNGIRIKKDKSIEKGRFYEDKLVEGYQKSKHGKYYKIYEYTICQIDYSASMSDDLSDVDFSSLSISSLSFNDSDYDSIS